LVKTPCVKHMELDICDLKRNEIESGILATLSCDLSQGRGYFGETLLCNLLGDMFGNVKNNYFIFY